MSGTGGMRSRPLSGEWGGVVKPGEQRDAVVGGHAAQRADAGELVGEELAVVVLQLADLLLLVGRDAVHRLRKRRVGIVTMKDSRFVISIS